MTLRPSVVRDLEEAMRAEQNAASLSLLFDPGSPSAAP